MKKIIMILCGLCLLCGCRKAGSSDTVDLTGGMIEPAENLEVTAGDHVLQVSLPENWIHWTADGVLHVKPSGRTGDLTIAYDERFGVCGTGLTEKKIRTDHFEGLIGYYDGKEQYWSFIVFREEGKGVYILNEGGGWSYGDEAWAVLNSLKFKE